MESDEQQVVGPPDVNTGDFDAVLAAAARGEYDNQPAGEESAVPQGAPSEAVAEPQGAPAPEAVAATPETPAAAQVEAPEDWQRKYHSAQGNAAQAAQQARAYQAQLAEAQRTLQAQQAEFQRQMQQQQHEANLRGSLPADEADVAIQEYRERAQKQQEEAERVQGFDAYQQYITQQHREVAEAKVQLFRQSVPSVMPDLGRHIAAQIGAPDEALVEAAASEPMQRAIAMIRDKRDMDLIAEVMAAFGTVEAKRDGARKAENAKQAVASGAFRSEPETARGAGLPEIDRIKAMGDKDFDKFVEGLVRASGG